MIHSIEEFLQVDIDDRAVSLRDVLLRFGHGLLCRTPRPKAVAVIRKCRVPSLLKNLQHRLLDESVHHGRNAELAHSSIWFCDFHPQYRLRLIVPPQQLFPNAWPVLLQMCRQLLDGHAVNASASFIGLNSFQCPLTVSPLADFFHQSFDDCRAFSPAFRLERFGPFGWSLRSFTPTFSIEGQLQLDFLPLVAHELRCLLTAPINLLAEDRSGLRPPKKKGRLLCPLLTSAVRSDESLHPQS